MLQDLAIEEQRDNLPYDLVPDKMQFPIHGIAYFNQFIFPQRVLRSNLSDENINNANNDLDQI